MEDLIPKLLNALRWAWDHQAEIGSALLGLAFAAEGVVSALLTLAILVQPVTRIIPGEWDDAAVDAVVATLQRWAHKLPSVRNWLQKKLSARPPAQRGSGLGGAVVLCLALSLGATASGCHAKAETVFREALAAGAHVVPDSADARIHQQDRLDARCRQGEPSWSEWRACMEPAYRVDTAVAVFSSTLLAAESAADASGEDGFRAMAPCLIEAARELSDAFAEAGLAVPEQVASVLNLGAAFTGECSR